MVGFRSCDHGRRGVAHHANVRLSSFGVAARLVVGRPGGDDQLTRRSTGSTPSRRRLSSMTDESAIPSEWEIRAQANAVLQRAVDQYHDALQACVDRLEKAMQRNGVDEQGMTLVHADDLDTLVTVLRRTRRL